MKIKAWDKTDIKMKCDLCGKEIIIPKNQTMDIPEATDFVSGGWHFALHNCRQPEGYKYPVLQVYTLTKTGKWQFKSRSLLTNSIR